ncbi:hypothetical protein P7C70_g7906, partial [Phenoliferia sp. Uapishka_3]
MSQSLHLTCARCDRAGRWTVGNEHQHFLACIRCSEKWWPVLNADGTPDSSVTKELVLAFLSRENTSAPPVPASAERPAAIRRQSPASIAAPPLVAAPPVVTAAPPVVAAAAPPVVAAAPPPLVATPPPPLVATPPPLVAAPPVAAPPVPAAATPWGLVSALPFAPPLPFAAAPVPAAATPRGLVSAFGGSYLTFAGATPSPFASTSSHFRIGSSFSSSLPVPASFRSPHNFTPLHVSHPSSDASSRVPFPHPPPLTSST